LFASGLAPAPSADEVKQLTKRAIAYVEKVGPADQYVDVATLAFAVQTGERSTTALRALDVDVLEPFNRAQMAKDGIMLVHTSLYGMLSIGADEVNPVAQNAKGAALQALLDAQTAGFSGFLDSKTIALQVDSEVLRKKIRRVY
jgi:hypothetical protein